MKNVSRPVKQISFILLVILFFYAESHSQKRYPNELGVFNFFTGSKLERLEPLVTTKQDVRKTLDEVYQGQCDWKDINNDAEIACKLSDWDLIVGFVDKNSENFRKEAWEKLEYIRVVPKIKIIVKNADFENKFSNDKGSLLHPHTIFNVYKDNYGLQYFVVKESIDSKLEPGRLFQIKYGYSKNNFKKYVKNN